MSDVIGRGIIEIAGDSSKLNASINDARRSINSLGEANKGASDKSSASIDRYIKRLEVQQKTAGMTARETDLYKLALRGASDEQLRAANSALRLTEANKRGAEIGNQIRTGFLAISAAAVAAVGAGALAIDQLIKKAGSFQDMGEKIGDTAENVASLAVAAGTAGTQMEAVASASAKLTKNLTGIDDESKAAGAAVAALGLNLAEFKALRPADQLEAMAKALAGFADGPEKTAVAMALLGKSGAELLPFLKELGAEGGRQNILTAEQIRLADEYSDRQSKLGAQISLNAQAIATEALPALNDFRQVIVDIAKDQSFAAVASDLLKGSISAAITVFQTVAVVGSDVAFVFKGVGREIGAIAAQLVALSSGNITGFHAISDAVREDAEKARSELDRFQAKIMGIGRPYDAPVEYGNEGRGVPTPKKPKIKFDGAEKKAGKASTYTDLLTPAAKEYASALEKINAAEIAAERSTLSLNSAQGALYDLMRSPEWESMPEPWKQTAIAQAAVSSAAVEAANSQKRLNDMMAATPTEQIKIAQEDMILLADALERGAISAEQFQEAATKRLDLGTEAISKQKSMAEELGLTFTSAFEDAVAGGKSFSDVLKGIEQDIIKLLVRKTVTEPLIEGVKGFDFGSIFSGLFSNAKGGVYTSPSLHSYANTVQTSPKTFAFANGGVFAEAGPEAIMPLSRGADGKLGVKSSGSAGVVVNINNNANGTRATQSTRQDAGGKTIIDVMIDTVKDAIAGDISNGGKVAGAMENQYGLNRAAGAWR